MGSRATATSFAALMKAMLYAPSKSSESSAITFTRSGGESERSWYESIKSALGLNQAELITQRIENHIAFASEAFDLFGHICLQCDNASCLGHAGSTNEGVLLQHGHFIHDFPLLSSPSQNIGLNVATIDKVWPAAHSNAWRFHKRFSNTTTVASFLLVFASTTSTLRS